MPRPDGRRSPTRVSLGTASLSISSLLVFSSVAKLESPVTLPPGRARLATKPAPTGSGVLIITMGMVVVAFLRRQRRRSSCGHDQINLKTNQVRRKLRQAVSFSLRKSILDGDILSFNPSKLAQLLPERLHEDRAYQKQCLDPGNLCGRLFLSAAPERKRKAQRAQRISVRTVIFLFMFFSASLHYHSPSTSSLLT